MLIWGTRLFLSYATGLFHMIGNPEPETPAQVRGSPVLLNLVTSLAHNQQQLKAGALPEPARSAAKARANDLSDTLRTILCL